MRIKAEAPCRIDLAGGTLDIHPLYLFLPEACTVNLAINLTVEVELEAKHGDDIKLVSLDQDRIWSLTPGESETPPPGMELPAKLARELAPDGGILIKMRSHSPPGAGLGASSALCIALASALLALRGENKQTDDLVRYCLDLEASVLGTPAGCQDFFASAYGGLREINFSPGEIVTRPLDANLLQLEKRISLIYTGKPHHSGLNNWEVIKSFVDGDSGVRAALTEIGYVAVQMAGALRSGDWIAVGSLLRREWENRKRLSPKITTPLIDELVNEAEVAGGAGKVCGAGGGGCVILWHDPSEEETERLAAKAMELGAFAIPWHPLNRGFQVKIES